MSNALASWSSVETSVETSNEVILRVIDGETRRFLTWLDVVQVEAPRIEGCLMPTEMCDRGLILAVFGDEFHVEFIRLNERDTTVCFTRLSSVALAARRAMLEDEAHLASLRVS